MMLDRDVVAVSLSSVYRVLKSAGRIGRSTNKPSKKGTGFHQPQKAHEHWHIDISYQLLTGDNLDSLSVSQFIVRDSNSYQ